MTNPEKRIRRLLSDEELQAGSLRKRQFRELGLFLRSIREARNLQQLHLASMAGLTQPTVSRLETGYAGNGPEFGTLLRYAEACNAKLVIRWEDAQSTDCVQFVLRSQEDELFSSLDAQLYEVSTIKPSLDVDSD